MTSLTAAVLDARRDRAGHGKHLNERGVRVVDPVDVVGVHEVGAERPDQLLGSVPEHGLDRRAHPLEPRASPTPTIPHA